MTFLPIVECELRRQARQARTYGVRFVVVLLGAMIALGLLSPSFYGLVTPDQTGRVLFLSLGGLAFAYCLVAGVLVTADAISEEKRQGTLGLLFLTDLRGHDVVIGKLVGRSLNAFYGLAAIFPVLALALLLGGVTAGEFWRLILVLLNTLFLSTTVGLWISARSTDGRMAMLGTLGLLLALAVVPWLVSIEQTPVARGPLMPWLFFSPASTAVLSLDGYGRFHPGGYVAALATQHLLAWFALVMAAVQVRNHWRIPSLERGRDWWPRLRPGRPAQPISHSAGAIKRRTWWLEKNPMLWLAVRDQRGGANLRMFTIFGLTLTALGGVALATTRSVPLVAVGMTWLAHLLVKLWLATEACRLLSEARQTGSLELLLVSPVRQSDIVEGLLAWIKRRFFIPVLLVLALDVVLLVMAGSVAHSFGLDVELAPVLFVVAGIFLADAYTLTWTGLWQGMAAPTLTRAILGTVTRVLLAPWGVFLVLSAGLTALNGGSPPSAGLLVMLWFIASYLTAGTWCAVSISRVTSGFRDMAAQEQEPGLVDELVKFFKSPPPDDRTAALTSSA